MEHFKIDVAGYTVEIKTIHTKSRAICRPFLTFENPVFSIQITEDDLENERAIFKKKYPKHCAWDGNLEVSTLLRKISEAFIDRYILLFHGASLSLENSAYIFSGPSNVGKTTHILKWLDNLSDAFVVNGDKPFIKFPEDGSQPLACGSPWAGKENMYTNTMVPLKVIICMERAETNSIHEITFSEAFPFLLQQTYRPEDETLMRKTLHLLQCLNGKVKFYKFYCNNFADDCFDVAYQALVEEESVD